MSREKKASKTPEKQAGSVGKGDGQASVKAGSSSNGEEITVVEEHPESVVSERAEHDNAMAFSPEAMRAVKDAHNLEVDEEEEDSPAEESHAAEASSLAESLREALALAEEHRQAHLRALAEMQNFRRRSERDNQQSRQYAIEGFARDLLLVADNLERALAAMPEEGGAEFGAMRDGVTLIQNELSRAFEKHGVARIKALNEPFDPNMHQAVVHVDDAQAQAGSVVQEMQAGYLLNGRLLRPAMVGVAKEAEEA